MWMLSKTQWILHNFQIECSEPGYRHLTEPYVQTKTFIKLQFKDNINVKIVSTTPTMP